MSIKYPKSKKFPSSKEAFLFAMRLFKNQRLFAKECGVCQQTISKWGRFGVPIKRAAFIEKLTKGKVTLFDLCPDIYPEE